MSEEPVCMLCMKTGDFCECFTVAEQERAACAIENAAFERAAEVAENTTGYPSVGRAIAAAIRKLKTDDITERDIAETMPPKPEEA